MSASPQTSGIFGAPLDAVVFNDDLKTRPSRPPDHEAEVRALATLVQALADSPQTILQALTDEMLSLFRADSAGISLLTQKDGEERFFWPAISGQWHHFIGGGTPRNFGPCGDVLDRNSAFLFRDLEQRYDYYAAALPRVEECLLVPFYLQGEAVGTLWIVAHDRSRQFDAEDLRQMESIGQFAASAYRTVRLLEDLSHKTERLGATEAVLRHRVSDLEAASAALIAANTDLSHFAYAASHDLQEPLRTIRVISELLVLNVGERLNARERSLTNSIIDGCTRMQMLLANLLAYIQASDAEPNPDDAIDLNGVFERAVCNLKASVEETQAVVTHDPLPRLRICAEHFVQLIQNLVGNSIKYRSARPPSIHLCANREQDRWHFILSDNGVGIAPEYQKSVFEVFRRLHGRDIPGTGLGLAICRRIAERYGGRIWVDSVPGDGATFHFTLHAAEAHTAAMAAESPELR